LGWFLGDLDFAESWLERSRDLLLALADDGGIAEMLFYHGLCLMTRGNIPAADADLEECVRLFAATGIQYQETLGLFVHGDVATRFDLVKARALYVGSLAAARLSGDIWSIARRRGAGTSQPE